MVVSPFCKAFQISTFVPSKLEQIRIVTYSFCFKNEEVRIFITLYKYDSSRKFEILTDTRNPLIPNIEH